MMKIMVILKDNFYSFQRKMSEEHDECSSNVEIEWSQVEFGIKEVG